MHEKERITILNNLELHRLGEIGRGDERANPTTPEARHGARDVLAARRGIRIHTLRLTENDDLDP